MFSQFSYSCSAWADSKSIRSSIDSFQRKPIRRLEKVHWPNVMKNEECDSVIPPLHQEVRLRRLKMLGPICGNDPPAKNILEKALKNSKRKRGRPPSTLLNTSIFEMNYLKLNMDNIEKLDKDAYREIIRTHC